MSAASNMSRSWLYRLGMLAQQVYVHTVGRWVPLSDLQPWLPVALFLAMFIAGEVVDFIRRLQTWFSDREFWFLPLFLQEIVKECLADLIESVALFELDLENRFERESKESEPEIAVESSIKYVEKPDECAETQLEDEARPLGAPDEVGLEEMDASHASDSSSEISNLSDISQLSAAVSSGLLSMAWKSEGSSARVGSHVFDMEHMNRTISSLPGSRLPSRSPTPSPAQFGIQRLPMTGSLFMSPQFSLQRKEN